MVHHLGYDLLGEHEDEFGLVLRCVVLAGLLDDQIWEQMPIVWSEIEVKRSRKLGDFFVESVLLFLSLFLLVYFSSGLSRTMSFVLVVVHGQIDKNKINK